MALEVRLHLRPVVTPLGAVHMLAELLSTARADRRPNVSPHGRDSRIDPRGRAMVAPVLLALNWFGDSLDGTLARADARPRRTTAELPS